MEAESDTDLTTMSGDVIPGRGRGPRTQKPGTRT